MKKSWHWLLYLDIILPVILYLLALLMNSNSVGTVFARIFHSYGLYVIDPMPVIKNFTGLAGFIIHVSAITHAVLRRDWVDLALSIIITAIVVLFFATGLNYDIIRTLNF